MGKSSGVVELDWPGLNRALELRAAIEYREQLNEVSNENENENLKELDENGQSLHKKKMIEPNPHYGLIKELWNTQNIIYDLWISNSINSAENIDLSNKINSMIEKNQSISIAKMLTKTNTVENDYLDDALVRNLISQHGNAAWNRLSDQEKFENLQKSRVELLKARKFGTNDQTIKNLMSGLDNDREFQMANKLKQQQRLEELKQFRAANRNLSVTEQKLESFNQKEYHQQIDQSLNHFAKEIYQINPFTELNLITTHLAIAHSNSKSDPLLNKMNNDVNAIKKFKGIRISHLKNHANFVKILQETGTANSNSIGNQNIDKLQKLQKEIHAELDILNNLVASSHLKISDILKLDPDEENDRLLALKSNEVELLNAVGRDENSQLYDSIQAKTDAQQDQILSQLLMKRYGEAEWNVMSQKEKQQRILKARMEILKESVDDKNWNENINLSNDTKFILGELEKDTNLKAKMIEGQKARQAALLEEKKRNIREGRMTEAEAQAEFKLQEKKIQEQFSDTKNVLKIIQFDA